MIENNVLVVLTFSPYITDKFPLVVLLPPANIPVINFLFIKPPLSVSNYDIKLSILAPIIESVPEIVFTIFHPTIKLSPVALLISFL